MANTSRRRSGRRWLWWALAIAGFVAAFIYAPPLIATAEAGTAYAARVGCSCHFVAEREMKSCATDKLDGMALITMVADEEAKSVTARFPLVASSTATHRKGFGCVLEKWAD